MSGSLGIAARAPRASGLKKPRPLRSTSVQENVPEKASGDGRSYLRQYSEPMVRQNGNQSDVSEQTGMCSAIAALSARVAHEAACEAEEVNAALHNYLILDNSHSSTSSTVRKSPSTDSTSILNQRNRPHSLMTELDCNYNNIFVPPVSPMSPLETRGDYANTPSPYQSYNSNRCNSTEHLGKGKPHSLRVEIPKLDSPSSEYGTSSGSASSQFSQSDSIAVATLTTEDGEDLVITGRNMKTILKASRVLLRELNAKLSRIDEISDPDVDRNMFGASMLKQFERQKSQDEKITGTHTDTPKRNVVLRTPQYDETPKRNAILRSPHNDETPKRTVVLRTPPYDDVPKTEDLTAEPQCDKQKYSKKQLLELSRSPLSTEAPACWNILSKTHSDVCIPAERVNDYFDPDFFEHHGHDGTFIRKNYGFMNEDEKRHYRESNERRNRERQE